MAPALPPQCQSASLLEEMRASRQPGVLARQRLQEGQQVLNQEFDVLPIDMLVAARARLVDATLCAIWQLFELDQEAGLALVAVGGYGRRELHPASDIDLLLLSATDIAADSELQQRLARFVTLLWDTGLEIGHSVRSLEQCAALARDDITVATNIMEARTLVGSDDLRAELVKLTAPAQMWPVADFFAAKRDEQLARYAKFNNTEYNLEPDIKRAPGGLRDLHTITWVTRRHFGSKTLEQLVATDFLTQRELSYLLRSRDLLWRIRWALHQLTGRNENRLLFDYQRSIAERLGYHGDSANLAVEHFMKDYYQSALAVSVLNEMLLQLFDEAILQVGKPQQSYPLNRHFQVHNHYLEAASPDLFEKHPQALLEIFVQQAQNRNIKGIRASTIRLMFEARHRIDDDYREDPANTRLFMALLRTSGNLFDQLTQMKRYGILAQYLPEFGLIIGMSQYDLFHIYSVDVHTLLVVNNLRKLRFTDDDLNLPLATRVYYRLPKPELLVIAGLFHDIAKGRGGDHSQLGATDAADFCRRHGVSRWDSKLVCWLVRNHLLMSVTAQRKDISDPAVVYDFARSVGDLVHLDYLYVLTVADISATNPKLWNSWREALLRQLHHATTRALRRGLNNPLNKSDWIAETRNEALALLAERGADNQQTHTLLASLGDEYFLRETADNIAWHLENILPLTLEQRRQPMIMIRDPGCEDLSGGTQIFIHTPDSKNLFAATVNALDHLDLTIVDARIITSSTGFSFDTYTVLDEKGTPIGNNTRRLDYICEQLKETLQHPDKFDAIVQRHLPRRYRHFDVPTQVIISNDLRNDCTVVDIQTLDHPGLLSHIGRIFTRFNLQVLNARILTLGERAEDVFFIADAGGQPLSDPEVGRTLRSTLQQELDDLPKQGTLW